MEATTTDCTWCKSDYHAEASHARDQQTFCSKKCELEARFWLFRLFQPVDK
ncbi:MAG: hypothetical protein M3P27_03070 [Acidobacteriota bacterium]|nr:hypothetical protein [Acidobacteriota bacterium]